MAFLDNSGDIILDATLTELGRKKMAQGTFVITKFAFGDDEISYTLYNKNHASGSAYYDLEILQTPIFEASTGENASINYGLMTMANNNLLYLPTIKRNEKVRPGAKTVSNVYYLAMHDGTTAGALEAAFGGTDTGGDLKVLRSTKTDGTAILLETGLDTTEIAGTSANKSAYISANGLAEAGFIISVDRRFIASVLGPGPASVFNNDGISGESNVVINLTSLPATTPDPQYSNNNMVTVASISNNVYKNLEHTIADTATSVIAGPRSGLCALNFTTRVLTADDFSRYGKTGQSIAGAAGTYRYIDTTVRVVGSTGITEQLPIRIIQKE